MVCSMMVKQIYRYLEFNKVDIVFHIFFVNNYKINKKIKVIICIVKYALI